jgi:hypothetical protein
MVLRFIYLPFYNIQGFIADIPEHLMLGPIPEEYLDLVEEYEPTPIPPLAKKLPAIVSLEQYPTSTEREEMSIIWAKLQKELFHLAKRVVISNILDSQRLQGMDPHRSPVHEELLEKDCSNWELAHCCYYILNAVKRKTFPAKDTVHLTAVLKSLIVIRHSSAHMLGYKDATIASHFANARSFVFAFFGMNI